MASSSRRNKFQRQGGEAHTADSSPAACFIAQLPESIIVEIFLKLAVGNLVRCRRVCRSWRRIISSPSFDQSRLEKGPSELVIFRSGKLFYFLEGEEPIPAAVSSHARGSRYGSRRPILHLVNSCSGLVCMTRCLGCYDLPHCWLAARCCHGKTIFVVNPVTSEYIVLPSCPKGTRMELCGLGFCPKTNQFKVFRILSKRSDWYDHKYDFKVKRRCSYVSDGELDEKLKGMGVHLEEKGDEKVNSDCDFDGAPSSGSFESDNDIDGDYEWHGLPYSAEVYTLGTGTWRRVEVDWDSLWGFFPWPSTSIKCVSGYHSLSYLNGSLYWIVELERDCFRVGSFNFETEQFQIAAGREFYRDSHVFGIGTYKNYLYLCRYAEPSEGIYGYNENFEVEHDLYRGGSVYGYDENFKVEYGPYPGVELFLLKKSWERETVVKFPKDFRINMKNMYHRNRVIKCFENGDILFFVRPYLYLLDNNKGTSKRVCDCKIRTEDDAVVHVPSFLLLRDVIKGESIKGMNVGSRKSQVQT